MISLTVSKHPNEDLCRCREEFGSVFILPTAKNMSRSTSILVAATTAGIALTTAAVFVWQRRKEATKDDKPDTSKAHDACCGTHDDNDDPHHTKKSVPSNVVVNPQAPDGDDLPRIRTPNSITIVHGSTTGTAQKLALQLQADLAQSLGASGRPVTRVTRTDEWDWWDELLNVDEDDRARSSSQGATPVLVLVLPTYTHGTWPPCAVPLQTALAEIQSDWRVAQFPLKKQLQVAVFGLGSSAYGDGTMGQPAREVVRTLQRLGAKSLVRLAVGDDSVGQDMQESFAAWSKQLQKVLVATNKGSNAKLPKQVSAKQKEEEARLYNDDDDDDEEEEATEPTVMDVEDMGDAVVASQQPQSAEPREMVTPSQAKALKKEGYQLIGTHSAVKLCRWTKHQLRGRGGCYKHTFYGITSYQCMEATPSLACANKVGKI